MSKRKHQICTECIRKDQAIQKLRSALIDAAEACGNLQAVNELVDAVLKETK